MKIQDLFDFENLITIDEFIEEFYSKDHSIPWLTKAEILNRLQYIGLFDKSFNLNREYQSFEKNYFKVIQFKIEDSGCIFVWKRTFVKREYIKELKSYIAEKV